MTENHPSYAALDREPGPAELTYRLTNPDTGTNIGLHFPPCATADELAAATRALVLDAFARSNPGGGPFPTHVYTDHHAEILTQATLDRIDELEHLLEGCRNALIDAGCPDNMTEANYDELLDDAAEVLGYPTSNDTPAPAA